MVLNYDYVWTAGLILLLMLAVLMYRLRADRWAAWDSSARRWVTWGTIVLAHVLAYLAVFGQQVATIHGFPFLVFAIDSTGRGAVGWISLLSLIGNVCFWTAIWLVLWHLAGSADQDRRAE